MRQTCLLATSGYNLAVIHRWPLVGRSEELAAIADAVRATGDIGSGMVLSGAPGVGKTRVAREAVAACGSPDARRHWIIGTASARNIPLGAFADVPAEFGPDPLRRVREVIDGLIGAAGHHEVIVGVDDAHLLDDLSAFTVHRLVSHRLATVILTVRSGGSPPDAITAIWKDQHLETLELQPLSQSEIANLLERVLGGPVHTLSARRLWQYTQGNVLYLRHLLDNEVWAGRLAQHAGVWLWEGQPRLSPTLAELLEARFGQIPGSVRDVLDAVAVMEPLDATVLTAIAGAGAVAEAESLGLITVDSSGGSTRVRLAHPMLGEVRRAGSLRLRQLRGQIATELMRTPSTDPHDLVRRAVLTAESDLAPDPGLLVTAASAAMQLMDQRLAEQLATEAAAAGGGIAAQLAAATAITWQDRGIDAEAVLAGLARQTHGPVRTQIALLRAMNFTASLGDIAGAAKELDTAIPADDDVAQSVADSLRAMIELARGQARTAVDHAAGILAGTSVDDISAMLAIWTLVSGLGDLGRADEIEPVAAAGYRLAESSAATAHLRLPLAAMQGVAYRLAGTLTGSEDIAEQFHRDTVDIPVELGWHSFFGGMSAMSRGDLAVAQRSLRETLAHLDSGGGGRMMRAFAQSWLATVAGMTGDAVNARRAFEEIEWWDRDPEAYQWDSEKHLALAWVCAAEGAVSQARTVLRDAAAREAECGRPGWETLLLQTATQFGDTATTPRLAELASCVDGPRAGAAAAHAAALAAGSGEALVDAARRYEAFADRIAAADAAAQAVIAYRHAGRRGAALSASAITQRLAGECPGILTPALRAVTLSEPFTPRQREIISLAATGLSNKDIAERLTLSVRSIEGHLFRACQRVGANGRDQLIDLLHGSGI